METKQFSPLIKFIFAFAISIGVAITLYLTGYYIAKAQYFEVQTVSLFDTSTLEAQQTVKFDKGKGTIRMLNGWCVDSSNSLVEDEEGNIWIANGSYTEGQAVLLWIVDNNTPDNSADDQIMKVWKE